MITLLGTSKTIELYQDFVLQSKNDPDIVVSCQYPFKVPPSIVDRNICVNIHYGILPEFAGCNPIYWQLMKGSEAGVTLHYMNNRFDAGDVIEIKKIPTANLTADEVFEQLSVIGLELLKKHYKGIIHNTAPRSPMKQNGNYYHKTDVNFKEVKHLGRVFLDGQRVRALHFEGKQYPVVNVDGLEYELRRVK